MSYRDVLLGEGALWQLAIPLVMLALPTIFAVVVSAIWIVNRLINGRRYILKDLFVVISLIAIGLGISSFLYKYVYL